MNICLFLSVYETHKCTVGKEFRIFLVLNLVIQKVAAGVWRVTAAK